MAVKPSPSQIACLLEASRTPYLQKRGLHRWCRANPSEGEPHPNRTVRGVLQRGWLVAHHSPQPDLEPRYRLSSAGHDVLVEAIRERHNGSRQVLLKLLRNVDKREGEHLPRDLMMGEIVYDTGKFCYKAMDWAECTFEPESPAWFSVPKSALAKI